VIKEEKIICNDKLQCPNGFAPLKVESECCPKCGGKKFVT